MAGKNGTKLSRAEQKARRPQEILDAAFEEFAANGYAATRVEDIAARLGVTKGTVYLYFPTKEALFEALSEHMSTPFADIVNAVDSFEGSYADRLRSLVLFAVEKIANDRKPRELLRLGLAESVRFSGIVDRHHDEFIAPMLKATEAIIAQGAASGEFRDNLPSNAGEVVTSAVLHVAILRLMFEDRKSFDGAAFIETHLHLVLSGLLKHPSSG